MYHAIIWTCDACDEKTELPPQQTPGRCFCGGTFQQTGETYDSEYVEQKKYEEQQDREYEERHRHDN